MTDDDSAVRARMLEEARVFGKYGLPRKQVAHLEALAARWPGQADVVAAWAAYDADVAAFVDSVARVVAGSAADYLGADGPLRIGRVLGREAAASVVLVERATLRFVEVTGARSGAVSIWARGGHGVVCLRDAETPLTVHTLAARLAAFGPVVENGDPGLGDVDDVLDAFARVTGAAVVEGADVGDDEPPHLLGGQLRFVAANAKDRPASTLPPGTPRSQRARIVIDVDVPRVVSIS